MRDEGNIVCGGGGMMMIMMMYYCGRGGAELASSFRVEV